MRRVLAILLAAMVATAPAASAESIDDVAMARIVPGWRSADGTHFSGLEIVLSPGWKTYWRAPGDAGIPPTFNWSGSRNLRAAGVAFPVPEIMDQNGMRSIGYHDYVLLPLALKPQDPQGDIFLEGEIEIGVCKEICVPFTLNVGAVLPAQSKRPSLAVTTAMANRPMSAAEAGVGKVLCEIEPIRDGMSLKADIDIDMLGIEEVAIVELADRSVWVAETDVERKGRTLTVSTEMIPPDAQPFVLSRGDIRITLLANGRAVDILGCG